MINIFIIHTYNSVKHDVDTSNWESKFEVKRLKVKVIGNESTKIVFAHLCEIDLRQSMTKSFPAYPTQITSRNASFLRYNCSSVTYITCLSSLNSGTSYKVYILGELSIR